MHIGTPLTHGNGRNTQLPCQPFTRLLVLNKNYFDSIKRSFAPLYLIKIECKYNKFQCLRQRIIKKSCFERLYIKLFLHKCNIIGARRFNKQVHNHNKSPKPLALRLSGIIINEIKRTGTSTRKSEPRSLWPFRTSSAQIKVHSLLVPTFEWKNIGKSLDMWRKFCNFALLFLIRSRWTPKNIAKNPSPFTFSV